MHYCLSQWRVFLLGAGTAASILGIGLATPAEARRFTSGHRTQFMTQKSEIRTSSRHAVRGHRIVRVRGTAAHERVDRHHRYARMSRQARIASEFQTGGYGDMVNLDQRTVDRRTGAPYRWGRQDIASAGPDRTQTVASAGSGGGGSVVSEARRWLGTNPTRRSRLWCGTFMNFVLERTGHRGTGSDLARSFASLGHRVSGPQVGAIAVMARRGRAAGGGQGGHVGVVSGVDSNGNPVIISGNHGRRVAEAVYPHNRVYAYVMPN